MSELKNRLMSDPLLWCDPTLEIPSLGRRGQEVVTFETLRANGERLFCRIKWTSH
jgi:hypothetical protein